MKLIVGLGNPGKRYRTTPHNVGYAVVETLALRAGLRWTSARKLDAEFADGRIGGVDCLLLKPTTQMNASGHAVAPLVRGEALSIGEDLLVALDDAALPLGRIRVRPGGSSGGHRGLDSIIAHLGSSQFPRLRCGIAPQEGELAAELTQYVLAPWPRALIDEVHKMVDRACDAAELWLSEDEDIEAVMNKFNPKDPEIPAP